MQVIYVEILEGRSDEKKKKMIKDMSIACAEALGCPLSAVKMIVSEMAPKHYASGGVTWDDQSEKPYDI